MVHAMRPEGLPTAPTDEFMELVCGDADLLRAEFDAIVAEEWGGQPPPADSPMARQNDQAPSHLHREQARSKRADQPRARAMRPRNRQRSPPR